MTILNKYLLLCRVQVSLFAACSALTGRLLAPSFTVVRTGCLTAGVFLLACGASALNQYQERKIDALMERTRSRPLPSGAMSPRDALLASLLSLGAGIMLVSGAGRVTAVLGLFAVLWYNGLYTWLKRRTAFAAVPGALVGAIPPLMGWAAGGGNISDPKIAAVAALFFLWQIPHFWLLLLRNGDDYERAGLPSLTRMIPKDQLARIIHIWITAAAVTSLGMPLFGIARSSFAYVPLFVFSAWIMRAGLRLVSGKRTAAEPFAAFSSVNLYLFAFMVLVSLDSILTKS